MDPEKVQQLIESTASQLVEHLQGDVGLVILASWTDQGETHGARANRGNMYICNALAQEAAAVDSITTAERITRRAG